MNAVRVRGWWAAFRKACRAVVAWEEALAQARARGDLLEAALARTRQELAELRSRPVES